MSCPFNLKFGKDHDSSDMCNLCKDDIYTECGNMKNAKIKKFVKKAKPKIDKIAVTKNPQWDYYGR